MPIHTNRSAVEQFFDDGIALRSRRGKLLAKGLKGVPKNLSYEQFLDLPLAYGLDFVTSCEMYDEYRRLSRRKKKRGNDHGIGN